VNDNTGKRADEDANLATHGRELYDLLVAYTKQETTEPLKGLGRYIGYGALGSVLVALGSTLLVIGILRVLQTETGTTFTGSWSWAPYLLTLIAIVIMIAGAVAAIKAPNTPGEKAAVHKERSDGKDN